MNRIAHGGACIFGAVLALLAASMVFAGAPGLLGMALGLASAIFGVAALWQIIKLVGTAATQGANPKLTTAITIIAFLMKIPVYIVLGGLAWRLGGAAPGCFLTGVVLVYSGLIAWAVTRK